MPGLGDYEKKKKGERGFKMNGPLFYKDGPLFQKKKHFLERDAAGPIAEKKPIDRDKFEEYTSVMQGMENVREELFSDEMTHEIVKKNLKNKKKDKPVKPKEGDMKKYSDLEKYDDDK